MQGEGSGLNGAARRAATRHPDDPGPGGADRGELVLEPIFEADFDPAAYGYRPKRSASDAIQAVLVLLRQGHTDVVDAERADRLSLRRSAHRGPI